MMALKVQQDRVVRLAYRILDGEGRLLEERTPEQFYEYLHGRGQIVAPVERALSGKTAGYRAEILVPPNDGYGQYDPSLLADLPRSHFPAGRTLEVGMKFNTRGPDGKEVIIRITEIEGDTISVDGNHPLAGLDLYFDLRILGVREARPEELDAGKVMPSSAH